MDNKIHYIGLREANEIRERFRKKNEIYFVEIDGFQLQSWNLYVDKMNEEFRLPLINPRNRNAYLDWMTDLDWLNKESYILMILNYNYFMTNDVKTKEILLKQFEKTILPFWEKDIETVMVDGYPKSFQVYLVV